ncbi:DMT family transporter [Salinicola avicenniae]|uniref:DMT family transporter n=1 Tax=Salinicola avicenniae TaxID=2916836 RepID=UPI002073BED2|nr:MULTISPECIES: EamA family transporter [unclassified Salinicola]
MTKMPQDPWGIAAVMAAATLWGTTGTAATFAPGVSPLAIGAVAMGFGGLLQALTAAGQIAKGRALIRAHWRCVVVGALAVAIYPLAFYAAMRYAGVTIGTVVSIGSAPLLSALIENVLDGTRLSRRWVFGASLGLAGMLLLCVAETGGETVTAGATGSRVVLGIGLGLLAGFTYAFYSWAAHRLMRRGVATRAAMGAMFGIGGLALMPVLWMTGAPLLDTWNNLAVGVYMAVVPMFIGYYCFGRGLSRVSASTATTITLFEPVVAAGLAVVVVGEMLPPLGWLGVALVVACLVAMTLPRRQRAGGAQQAVPDEDAAHGPQASEAEPSRASC